MAFEFQPVVQASQQQDKQDQAQAMNQMLQFGHLMMYKEKTEDLEQDRQFKAYGAILSHPEFGDDMHLQAVNGMAKMLKIPGEVTMDGLKPMSALMKTIMKDHATLGDAGMDWSKYGPAIGMIQANPRLITMAQLPDLATATDSYNTFRATRAVNLSNPETNYVAEARQRIDARRQDLEQLRGEGNENRNRLWSIVNGAGPQVTVTADGNVHSFTPGGGSYGPNANAKATAQEQLDRLRVLEDEDQQDQAAVNEDTHRKALNSKVVQFVKGNPNAIDALEKHGLQAAGIYPTDDNFMKARYNQLLQIPDAQRTEEDTRQLDLVQTYLTGKSAVSMRAAATAQRVTQELQQVKAESQAIGEVRTSDQQGQEQAETHRATIAAIGEGVKTATQTEEDWQRRGAETRGFSEFLGAQQNASLQANAPKAQAFQQDRQRLEEDANELRKRLTTMPSGQRDDTRSKIRMKEDLVKARDAQVALLTTHHPLRGLNFEWDAQMGRQNADHIKTALGRASLTPEEKTALDNEYLAADKQATTAEANLKTWTGERNNHLAALNTAQASLDNQSRVLDQQKTGTQRAMEKDEATAGLYQTMLTDMTRDGLTMTQAFTKNYKDFPNADGKKAQEDAINAHKFDYGNATNSAQYVFSGLVAASDKEELTPKDLSGLAAKAAAITKKAHGILVGTDDILKAYEKGKTSLEIKVPDASRRDSIETRAAWEGARPIIGFMKQTITDHPDAVGVPGKVQQMLAGISQQWGSVFADAQKAGTISPSAMKYFSSQPTDELEAASQILTYHVARALSPVGVISDQDAAAARAVVGDVKSWRQGSAQLLNKLNYLEGWFYAKAQGASQLLQDPKTALGSPPSPPAGSAGSSPKTAPTAPKTAEEFLQFLQGGGR